MIWRSWNRTRPLVVSHRETTKRLKKLFHLHIIILNCPVSNFGNFVTTKLNLLSYQI